MTVMFRFSLFSGVNLPVWAQTGDEGVDNAIIRGKLRLQTGGWIVHPEHIGLRNVGS
jgi:hypothetical protein